MHLAEMLALGIVGTSSIVCATVLTYRRILIGKYTQNPQMVILDLESRALARRQVDLQLFHAKTQGRFKRAIGE